MSACGTYSAGVGVICNLTDPYRWGHYQAADLITFSKVEAMEWARSRNQSVTWHFNDKIFGAIDTRIEPHTSLSDLYQSRARQISNSYDYVVLFYSGGADSHNMLESFLHANARFDEIVSLHNLATDQNPQGVFNREIFNTAVPYVDGLKTQGRLSAAVPHRLLDMSNIIAEFNNAIDWHTYPYLANTCYSINNIARGWLRSYVQEWQQIIDQGKTLALVWGHDKPRVAHDNNFYFCFMDVIDNCVGVWQQINQPNGWFDELFYTTSDMPEIVIKQAHVIKKFLELAPEHHDWLTDHVTGLGHVIKHRPDGTWVARWLRQDAQSLLIYPWWDQTLYYEPKPLDTIRSLRDRWFWSDPMLSTGFNAAVDSLEQTWHGQWLQVVPEQNIRAVNTFRSCRYWL